MVLITASEFNKHIDKYLSLSDTEEVMIVRGRWNSKYYMLTPILESESIPIQQTDFQIGDKVIVTEKVQHNDTGQNLEAVIIDIENNPFRGLVLAAKTSDNHIYFDVAEHFIKQ